MNIPKLPIKERSIESKGASRRLRKEGVVPAILYGPDRAAMPISVNGREIARIFRKGFSNNILNLTMDSPSEGQDAETTALIKDVQKDILRGDILHVDFLHVSMDKAITTQVPLEFSGEPAGVKSAEGVLQTLLREIEIECLPGDIPQNIQVDLSELDVGDSLHVRDLKAENVKILNTPDDVVVTVTQARAEEEVAPVEAEEGAEGEEVAEGEEKKEEGEEKKEEGEEKKD